jgi:hypothetical protein
VQQILRHRAPTFLHEPSARSVQLYAPTNSGPGTRSGNSGVSGSPSVSWLLGGMRPGTSRSLTTRLASNFSLVQGAPPLRPNHFNGFL